MTQPLLFFLILGTLIHTQADMNRVRSTLNSHAGQEQWSSLEPIHRYTYLHPTAEFLPEDLPSEQRAPFYPRIKKMEDGRFILFVQGGQTGSRVYSLVSDDYLRWYGRVRIAGPEKITLDGKTDWRRYTTVDAVVMPGGEILAAISYRADAGYTRGQGCGIVLVRSSDHGESWGEQQLIYEGPNWEPYLLSLPDGRLQCYFTDATPQTRNSGTSLIESFDGGKTWSAKKRICRQFKYWDKGERIFTDQMPVFRVLNDGKTLFGIEEARLEPDGAGTSSIYNVSLVWNHGAEWKDLGEDTEGPADKKKNLWRGNAGYIATFPSGEVVISTGIGGYQSLKVGDHTARHFNGKNWDKDWLQPFDRRGIWATCEAVDDHHLAFAMDNKEGLLMGLAYLNHRVDAPVQTTTVDGDDREWRHTEALFIGSDHPTETIFRFASDGKTLYVLAEQVGESPIDITLHDADVKKLSKGHSLSFSVGRQGLVSGGNDITVICREGMTKDGRDGYLAEIAIPLSLMGLHPDGALAFYASIVGDTFTGVSSKEPHSWPRVHLTNQASAETRDEEIRKPFLRKVVGSDVLLPEEILGKDIPLPSKEQHPCMYPRIKRMADGRFILFYHGGRFGSRVFCMDSDDLMTWSKPRMLFSPKKIVIDGEEDIRRFVNPDAVVLPDGDILMVCSYRAERHYSRGVGGGLMLIRSSDNGKTWSAPQQIYDGMNWEPYLLLLPDGRIQCYFTDATPQCRNSGTSVMVSSDGGKTWSPKIRCSRQFKYLYDGPHEDYWGTRIFTDQMPSFRVLKDGKTIIGFLEARLERPLSNQGQSYCKMSVVYQDGLDWSDLGENTAGPSRRISNVMIGAAGYVSVFPSGEVVLSCNRGGRLWLKLLSEQGTLFPGEQWKTGWLDALLEDGGYWGSTEVISEDRIVAAMHGKGGIQICQYQLVKP